MITYDINGLSDFDHFKSPSLFTGDFNAKTKSYTGRIPQISEEDQVSIIETILDPTTHVHNFMSTKAGTKILPNHLSLQYKQAFDLTTQFKNRSFSSQQYFSMNHIKPYDNLVTRFGKLIRASFTRHHSLVAPVTNKLLGR